MTTIIPGLYGLDSTTAFKLLQKDPQKYINNFTKSDKQLQVEKDYFTKKLATYKTSADLFKDTRAMKYVMEAYGLGSETDSMGLIKKVLSQDPTATTSLATQLSDTRYKTMATALRLDKGLDGLKSLATSGKLQTSYIQNEFEEALGDQDNALREAAYFARSSTSISSVYGVLGDKVLRDVVTKTLSLPAELAIQPIESQAAAVAKKVDITKFAGTTGTATSVTAAQLARATSDHTLIENNLKISDAAAKQVKSIQDTISQLSTNYSALPTITDPNGANADTIAIQQAAVPELVRYNELLNASNKALTTVNSSLTSLKSLITQAGKSGSDLASLKSQFADIVTTINDAINGATITNPDGTTENPLLNGTADTLTTVYDASGSSITINRYDLSGLQTFVNDANTVFNSVADNTDTSSLTTALSRILRGQDAATAATTKVTTDTTALTKVGTTGFFAATLNTSELTRGSQSITDGLSRITQINTLLGQIKTAATQAAALDDSADHSALETSFNTYKTQLQNLIENTGTVGLDNLLNNSPDQTYEIVNGKTITVKGGIDLETQLSAVLNGSLSDAASAQALKTGAIQGTTYTSRATAALNVSKPIIDATLGSYDPRGKLDAQVYKLQTQISTLVSGAASGTNNLLSSTQKDIKLSSLSTGTSLTFHAVPTFQTDVTTGLNNVVTQFAGNDINSILDALDDVSATLNSASHTITGDNRVATIEYGKLGSTIDALDPKNTATSSALYQTNTFTQKFIARFLTTNGSNGNTASSTSYLSGLFDFSTDSSSAISNIFSLVNSLKA